MQKVDSYEQIQGFVSQIRSLKNGFVTNFYWDSDKHSYWIEDSSFFYEQSERCFLLFHTNPNFVNLFYIAISISEVASFINTISLSEDIVIDIVCKGEGYDERRAFSDVGFEEYKQLYRMCHIGTMNVTNQVCNQLVQQGSLGDILQINSVFKQDFDPLCEQLPSLKEIEDYINKNRILVVKNNGLLCGFLIYEIVGVSWYLRYWYTAPKFRNLGVGGRLLRSALYFGKDTKRQQLWVIADNANAIERYEHYGFVRENMNDFVMIKRV